MSHISIGSILPVGTIIHSMLTTTQFATQYGDNWVLADGRSVTGTLYASVTGLSTVPDMRGRFLRGKGASNPDGDLALGAFTSSKTGSHDHAQNHQTPNTIDNVQVPSYRVEVAGGVDTYSIVNTMTDRRLTSTRLTTDSTGGNETAPVSITVNIFIRIN
jgi:hypothetical protein